MDENQSNSPEVPAITDLDAAFASWCALQNVDQREVPFARMAFEAAYGLGKLVANVEAAIESTFGNLDDKQPPGA